MTRKDYVKFAEMVSSYLLDPHDRDTSPLVVAGFLALRMADIFEDDNPRFDRERFLDRACDVPIVVRNERKSAVGA